MKTSKKIFSVSIVHHTDESPETDFLGKYSDSYDDWALCRCCGEYLAQVSEDHETPDRGREYRFFLPYAGGEKQGTKNYQKYGKQDFERMESLNSGNWYFLGVSAVAKIGVSFDGGKNWKLDTITSGGLWGIESDSDRSYIEEVEKEQLDDLFAVLKAYGFRQSQITKIEVKEAA